jgi:citronellyl-CoA dehydrogenase
VLFELTPEQEAFRTSLRTLIEREINPHVDEWERAGTFPAHELFPKLGALGVFGLQYDEAYGGLGAGHLWTMLAAETIGEIHCNGIPMAITVQMAMSTPALHRYGSHELKTRFLAPAIAGTAVTSIAVTESDAGSDVGGLRTRAVRDGDDWVINGSKLYITNGTQADWICLLARTSDEGGYRGMTQIVVPTDTPGFAVSRKLDKLGNRSSDTAELSFTDMRVPVDNTIGEIGRGFQQQMVQFQDERLIGVYGVLAGMRNALARTRDYVKERMAFGRPLIANQEIQFRLAELSAELDMLTTYCRVAAHRYAAGEDVSRQATIAKLQAGKLIRRIADTCLQYHGGSGYMEENWTARYFRDTRLLPIGGGADEVMLRILARTDGFTDQ